MPYFGPAPLIPSDTGVDVPSNTDFIIRPWSRLATTGVFYSQAIDARERLGILIRLEIEALNGTSPSLDIITERSIDKRNWSALEGTVDLDATGGYDIERHQLGGWLRVYQKLNGSGGPDALYRISARWLDHYDYRVRVTAAWDSPPLTEGNTENFTAEAVVPGANVSWTAKYYDSTPTLIDTETGNGTADKTGQYTSNGLIAFGTSPNGSGVLTVETLGLTATDTETIT